MLVAGLVLFIWSGISQNLPWGVRSVKPDVQNEAAIQAIADEQQDGMLYLNGDIVALVAAKPKSYYSSQRFFAVELVTQLVVGVVLCLLLAQLPNILIGASSIYRFTCWFTHHCNDGLGVLELVGILQFIYLGGSDQ